MINRHPYRLRIALVPLEQQEPIWVVNTVQGKYTMSSFVFKTFEDARYHAFILLRMGKADLGIYNAVALENAL
jgi:hypothetical protein